MIKFFRKIRQNLLMENKTGKYFKYAIGEIVLVVIGILIALQINNWNEGRKEAVLELKTLKNLHNDLESNETRIKSVISNDSTITSYNRIILKIMNDDTAIYNDSLQKYFGKMNRYDIFNPKKMAYETMKSNGLEIIKNDSITSKIIELFDDTYLLNSHMIELKRDYHIITYQLFNKRFATIDKIEFKSPVDFESLKSDTEFINTLSHMTAENENFINILKSILDNTTKVKNLLAEEINRLEK